MACCCPPIECPRRAHIYTYTASTSIRFQGKEHAGDVSAPAPPSFSPRRVPAHPRRGIPLLSPSPPRSRNGDVLPLPPLAVVAGREKRSRARSRSDLEKGRKKKKDPPHAIGVRWKRRPPPPRAAGRGVFLTRRSSHARDCRYRRFERFARLKFLGDRASAGRLIRRDSPRAGLNSSTFKTAVFVTRR